MHDVTPAGPATRRAVLKAPVSHGTFVTVLMGVPLFLIVCLLTGQILNVADLSGKEYGLLALAGCLQPVAEQTDPVRVRDHRPAGR